MKKILALVLALALIICASFALAEEEVAELAVMSHEEYALAELDAPVLVEAYVQDSQGWWAKDGVGRMTLYLQAEDGAYFAYEVLMEEEESKLLVPGTKIRITGVKGAWADEVEILDATYEILDAEPWIAEPTDVTALLGSEDLIDHINEKIAIKNAKVVASTVEGDEKEYAFLYSYDNSGDHEANSDLYFKVEVDGSVYTLTVESYLRGNDTDVYAAVEALQIGDVIDCEGFLYWYYGANPHITSVTKAE